MGRFVAINLPVADLARSRAFFAAMGFGFNEDFSDATAACLMLSDTTSAMLLTPAKFDSFAPLPRPDPRVTTGVLVAVAFESRDAVHAAAEAGLATGGSVYRPPEDLGFMLTRAVCDPDGHVFELYWMDQAASATSPVT
jgi:uncharacterized protein